MAWVIIKKGTEKWGYQLLSAETRKRYKEEGFDLVYAHDEASCKMIMKGGKGNGR